MRRMALHIQTTRARLLARGPRTTEKSMLDLAMLALGAGFFLAGIGYAYACDRL